MNRFFAAMQLSLLLALGLAGSPVFADANELRAMHAQLREQLRNNSYNRPLYIESAESGDTLKGDVYAVLDQPFATVSEALKNPNDWCDILILPFNTKYC